MSINSFNSKFKKNRQLRLEMESTIDELEEIETKICSKLLITPDYVQEVRQSFIDTNPDYVNPLKLKDNSSRLRIFEHIEEAELLAEHDLDYVMRPFPLFKTISWFLNSQIPIQSYKYSSTIDLDSHLSKKLKNNEPNFQSSLLPIVTSTNEERLDLVLPIQEELDKELSSLANIISCGLTNFSIGTGVRNIQLQTITEEYGGDNKSVDVSPVNSLIANKNDIIDLENLQFTICSNNSVNQDKPCALDFGVISSKKTEILGRVPVYPYKKETKGFYWPDQDITENYDSVNSEDVKTNLKFQYASVIDENSEKEISKSEDDIILVCKECGFHEYI